MCTSLGSAGATDSHAILLNSTSPYESRLSTALHKQGATRPFKMALRDSQPVLAPTPANLVSQKLSNSRINTLDTSKTKQELVPDNIAQSTNRFQKLVQSSSGVPMSHQQPFVQPFSLEQLGSDTERGISQKNRPEIPLLRQIQLLEAQARRSKDSRQDYDVQNQTLMGGTNQSFKSGDRN